MHNNLIMELIILLGQRVRSGTNFIGTTLKQHPDVVCVPLNTSLGEMNLFKDSSIKTQIFDKVSKSFGVCLADEDFPDFMQYYGELWISFLVKKYNLPRDKVVFIKSPYIENVELWKLAFPNSQIAILSRDGRDNVISSIKASNDRRTWHTNFIRFKKIFNYYSGRSFYAHSVDWKKTANIYHKISETSKLKKIRYEDLNNSTKGIEELLNFYKLRTDPEIVKKCVSAPVVGSSFGISDKGMVKPNWEPIENKKNFKFTGKWYKWNIFQKALFKKIASKELMQLNYSKDNNW
ncbi:sulfotransferase [Aequorivita xiaoshiensis]|uniref:Sulfotransferase n=1 Tax=Aequorivita xiaoshiensis TaxID=2874476 RepID=A0A9X1R2Q6_9FLAO|nr:sulfotransferase [Aequorivita xiaoshiensis]MCG2430478.1 sulfotransferase [Aequorivita xiaoshiensis]